MKRLAVLSFLLLFCITCFAQTDSSRLKAIAGKLNSYAAMHPTEKVSLHLNKPAYEVGDTIWLKSYLTVGPLHLPSALNGILYVDLIDEKNKIVKSLKLKNDNGISAGDIALDSKIQPGNYRIKAYSTCMRNAGPDYFFNQTINISDIKTSAVFISSTYSVNSSTNDKP